jgi:hypothetical protein
MLAGKRIGLPPLNKLFAPKGKHPAEQMKLIHEEAQAALEVNAK